MVGFGEEPDRVVATLARIDRLVQAFSFIRGLRREDGVFVSDIPSSFWDAFTELTGKTAVDAIYALVKSSPILMKGDNFKKHFHQENCGN
jgi:hypothetical protein